MKKTQTKTKKVRFIEPKKTIESVSTNKPNDLEKHTKPKKLPVFINIKK